MSADRGFWPRNPRALIDVVVTRLVALGGISVIIAILLIFVYLTSVVAPLLAGASAEPLEPLRLPGGEAGNVRGMGFSENSEFLYVFHSDGRLDVLDLESDARATTLELEGLSTPIRRIHETGVEGRFAVELSDQAGLLFVDVEFPVRFLEDTREVRPQLDYPFDTEPLQLSHLDAEVLEYEIAFAGDELLIASRLEDGRVDLTWFQFAEAGLPLDYPTTVHEFRPEHPATRIHMGGQLQWLYLLDDRGEATVVDITFKDDPVPVDRQRLIDGERLVSSELMLGGISLLVADEQGRIGQWFPVRNDQNDYQLVRPRTFTAGFVPRQLISEYRRKGFVAIAGDGRLGIFHTTSERTLLEGPLLGDSPARLALSARADRLAALMPDGRIERLQLHNEHPEVSLSSLWGKVWYEGYSEPVYSWQSSAASNDFEPKFSLTPLAFGTFKAAIYAMLFAMPLAIMGAIYTAYFMSAQMRSWVKPTIEIMEALPTVILGFLAGLWLAPLVEANLTAVLGLILVMPFGIIAFGMLLHVLPVPGLRRTLAGGWHAAVLVPVICLLTWFVFAVSPLIEATFFGGDLQALLLDQFGLGYDQRNALVVGLTMGLAVIPTIFSIAEDAIFSVPRHLVHGSLALGATPWQTLARVVLLTASPGIFSAVMIGFGRAVGETMIVLMATGNTPVLDLSIFQGMRTFSANIAVELPESEVGSTHYRILFLAALVLFAVTFFFNTVAELVRQRLRSRYGSL